MKTISILALPLALASQSALAEYKTHGGALVTAALVGGYAPSLNDMEKSVLQKLLDGQIDTLYPANKKISVKADAVSRKANNIDITGYMCELTFETNKVTISGRKAHELYATFAEIGIFRHGRPKMVDQVEHPADIIFEALSNLNCTIDPAELRRKAGGGAECRWEGF
jgi:hypothetical protein